MSFYELNPEPRALLITTFFILICTSMYCIPIVYRRNKLLPKIFPNERLGFFNHTVEDKVVNNSGSEVTAESNTPPINAPEISVFLSIKSTYTAALMDKNTTRAANNK